MLFTMFFYPEIHTFDLYIPYAYNAGIGGNANGRIY